jgi:TPR repeat protein
MEKFYMRVDPNKTPVYVQVDPESPGVYVAVDPNLARINLKDILPKINFMRDASGELMAQNKWLAGALNVCLDQFEAERQQRSVKVSPSDYVNRSKPIDPNEMPYEKVQYGALPETVNVETLSALMNLHCMEENMYIYPMREYIKRVEQRMSHIQNKKATSSTAGGGAASASEENKMPLPTAYLEELRQKAEGGDAMAACDLGWCYFNGNDITRDYNEASKWFREAVAGIATHREQNNLGWCYYRGIGIEPNYAEPEKWFRQEAEKGNADAQYFLGWLYTYGSGDLKQDESEAVKWWQKSAEQGFAEAQYELGIAYFYGIGVEANHDEGTKWQRKAAEQGLALAQSQMELCLSDIADPNHSERISWLQKAARQGYTIAQSRLGLYAERGWNIIEGYKWSLLAEKNESKDRFSLSLREGNRLMNRKPMTDEQIAKGEQLARNFKEVKSEVTARSVTTMYQAMTLWKEGTEAHYFFFPPFW